MEVKLYALTSENLAMDGTVEQFYELYSFIYDTYIDCIRQSGNFMPDPYCFDRSVLGIIIKPFEKLVSRRIKLFTREYNYIRLSFDDFKYFSFFDKEKEQHFKWKAEFYLSHKNRALTKEELLYCKEDNGDFHFEKTAIGFEKFLVVLKLVVARAIYRIKKSEGIECTPFEIRDWVESAIEVRMRRRREECKVHLATTIPPTDATLYLFESLNSTRCKRWNHNVVPKTFCAGLEDGVKTVMLPVHYCTECKKYMMGTISYRIFIDRFGKFTQLINKSESLFDEPWGIDGESKLHSLGYTVVEGKFSSIERQKMLERFLDSNQISFFEMVSTIEQNIRLFSGQGRFYRAVQKWKDDLKHISEYELKKKGK